MATYEIRESVYKSVNQIAVIDTDATGEYKDFPVVTSGRSNRLLFSENSQIVKDLGPVGLAALLREMADRVESTTFGAPKAKTSTADKALQSENTELKAMLAAMQETQRQQAEMLNRLLASQPATTAQSVSRPVADPDAIAADQAAKRRAAQLAVSARPATNGNVAPI